MSTNKNAILSMSMNMSAVDPEFIASDASQNLRSTVTYSISNTTSVQVRSKLGIAKPVRGCNGFGAGAVYSLDLPRDVGMVAGRSLDLLDT